MKTTYPVPDIFSDHPNFIVPAKYFYHLFGKVPNSYNRENEYDKKILEVLVNAYGSEAYFAFREEQLDHQGYPTPETYIIVLKKELMIHYNCYSLNEIRIYCADNKQDVDELLELLKPHIIQQTSYKNAFVLIEENDKLVAEYFEPQLYPVDVETHYNDDFLEKHVRISEYLETRETGLVVLAGDRGYGKTTYLLHLINMMDRKVIFVNPYLFSKMSYADFINLMAHHPNSVLVFEDCEELTLMQSGKSEHHASIYTLLQIAKDYYAEALNIKFIITFNTDAFCIYTGILDSSSVITCYQFGKLAAEKVNWIIQDEKLKIEEQTEAISLAELYENQ